MELNEISSSRRSRRNGMMPHSSLFDRGIPQNRSLDSSERREGRRNEPRMSQREFSMCTRECCESRFSLDRCFFSHPPFSFVPESLFLNLLAFIVRSSLSFDRQCQFCSLGKGGKTAERSRLSNAKRERKLPIASSIFFSQFFNGNLGLTALTPLRLNVPRDVKGRLHSLK